MDDATSVRLWVEELKKSQDNPVIIYKPQGMKQSEDCDNIGEKYFVIGIQTPLQESIMKTLTNGRVVCVDGTHGTNGYDFMLITVIVIDEYGGCFARPADLLGGVEGGCFARPADLLGGVEGGCFARPADLLGGVEGGCFARPADLLGGIEGGCFARPADLLGGIEGGCGAMVNFFWSLFNVRLFLVGREGVFQC